MAIGSKRTRLVTECPNVGFPMTYGQHILCTGRDAVAFEQMLGRFLYQRHFVGMAPILDLAAGRCWFTRQNVDDTMRWISRRKWSRTTTPQG